jgi:hypothetical protein
MYLATPRTKTGFVLRKIVPSADLGHPLDWLDIGKQTLFPGEYLRLPIRVVLTRPNFVGIFAH